MLLLAADRGAAPRRRHRLRRACGCAATCSARTTAWPRRRTSASRRRIRAEYHSRRAGRVARGPRRPTAPAATRTPSASACTASTCTPRPAATTTSTWRAAVPHPARRAAAGADENLLPAAKNIGTTHITNGCYRLHPVEWNIGEVAGALAANCLDQRIRPGPGRTKARSTSTTSSSSCWPGGVELHWPQVTGY